MSVDEKDLPPNSAHIGESDTDEDDSEVASILSHDKRHRVSKGIEEKRTSEIVPNEAAPQFVVSRTEERQQRGLQNSESEPEMNFWEEGLKKSLEDLRVDCAAAVNFVVEPSSGLRRQESQSAITYAPYSPPPPSGAAFNYSLTGPLSSGSTSNSSMPSYSPKDNSASAAVDLSFKSLFDDVLRTAETECQRKIQPTAAADIKTANACESKAGFTYPLTDRPNPSTDPLNSRTDPLNPLKDLLFLDAYSCASTSYSEVPSSYPKDVAASDLTAGSAIHEIVRNAEAEYKWKEQAYIHQMRKTEDACRKKILETEVACQLKIGESEEAHKRIVQETADAYKRKIREAFRCNMCFFVPRAGAIRQCQNGHLFCSACAAWVTSNSCRRCQAPLRHRLAGDGTMRARSVERLIEAVDLEFACRHLNCGFSARKSVLAPHEGQCEHRAVPCPYGGCDREVPFRAVLEHIMNGHKAEHFCEDDHHFDDRVVGVYSVRFGEPFLDPYYNVPKLMYFEGSYFVANFSKVGGKYYAYMHIIGDAEQAKLFSVGISIGHGSQSRIFHQGQVFPVDKRAKDVLNERSGVLSFGRDGMYDALFHGAPDAKSSDWPKGLTCRQGIRLHLQITKVTSLQLSDFSESCSSEGPPVNWSEVEGAAATLGPPGGVCTNFNNITNENDGWGRSSRCGSRGFNFPSNPNSGNYSTNISATLVKNSSSGIPGQPRHRDHSRGRMYHLDTLNNSSGEQQPSLQPRHRGHSRERMHHVVEDFGNAVLPHQVPHGDSDSNSEFSNGNLGGPLVNNGFSGGQHRSQEHSRRGMYH